jgi:uncharacterized protein HemX
MNEDPKVEHIEIHADRINAIELAFKKLKNSGYVLIAGLILNAGIWYQGGKDFTETQRSLNARQQIVNEQQTELNAQNTALISRMDALIAGQERRLQLLENRLH